MLVSAAVCPHPPALVPELSSGAAADLAEVRSACAEAADALRMAAPQRVIVVGGGESRGSYRPGATGSFRSYGVGLDVALPGPPGEAATPVPATQDSPGDDSPLPLSIAVGAWLLRQVGWDGAVGGEAIGTNAGVEECVGLGVALSQAADRVGLLVMGDGSARRTETGPRRFHPRAGQFDSLVVEALATADPKALLAVDPGLATELVVAGRAAWQVLAGAAGEATFDGEVLYSGAPLGVGYIVAVWERHG